MNRYIRHTLLMLGVTLLVLPAAVSDGKQRERVKQDKQAKHLKGDKQVAYVFKGSFHAADSSVTVLRGNKHVRRAGMVGQTVVFDLSEARIKVADTNGDGKRDVADVQEGDKVVVQARLPRRAPGAAPFAARKLVDQTHEQGEGETPESHDG